MNIAKKILFGLLLSASVFTAACGTNDDGNSNKVKEGKECKAADACDTGLACVITQANATKGVCTKTCTTATEATVCTTGPKKCSTANNAIVFGQQQPSQKTCMVASATTPGTAEQGATCDTADGTEADKTCKPNVGLVCATTPHGKMCLKKCEVASEAADCTEGTYTKCLAGAKDKENNAINTCQPPRSMKLAEGAGPCDPAATDEEKHCDTGLTCGKLTADTDFVCLKECTDATAATVCTAEGFKTCADGTKKEGDAAAKFCKG